jgi:hypothetical protein
MNPFVDALNRAEKIIALFYQGMNDLRQIADDSLLDDDEKVAQIRERLDRLKKDLLK